MIYEKGNRPNLKIVFETDPKLLVEKVMAHVLADRQYLTGAYSNYTPRKEDIRG
jgi:hypothetical protein